MKLIKLGVKSKMTNISQKWLSALDVLVPVTRDYSGKIYASEVARKTKIPQKTVHRKLELLVKNNLLNYVREGKNKHYFLDFNQKSTFSLLAMVESFKELNFINNHPEIGVLFNEVPSNFILFGSYAKGLAKKNSDIDLIIIGKENEKINKVRKRSPFEINIFYFTSSEFRKFLDKEEHLAKEVIKDHILFGEKEKIIEMFK